MVVSHLTFEMTTRADDMIYYTNSAFSILNWILWFILRRWQEHDCYKCGLLIVER